MARLPFADQLPWLAALVRGEAIAPPDDEALATAVVRHRLAGYADAAIMAGRWRAGEEVAARLRDTRGRGTLHAALLRRELGRVAPMLVAACGVRPVVVKGPVLAERVHGDRTLRPYLDLDVVVPRSRMRDAAAALVEAGWSPPRKPRSTGALGEPFAGFAEAYGHDLLLSRDVGAHRADIELHWRVSEDAAAARLDHGLLASRAVELPALGPDVLAPHPVDELLLVCLHLLHHRRVRLMWAVDVALAREALDADDWNDAFALARELDLSWALHAGLDLAETLLGPGRARPVPPPRRAAFGALRATQALPGRLGEHVGRLAALGWRERGRYTAAVGAATWRRAVDRAAGR